MGDLSRDFDRAEFACRCGCGANQVSPRLVAALQDMRRQLGRPIAIRSGCRCPTHNAAEGGKPDSAHLSSLPGAEPVEACEAADLVAAMSRERYALVAAALMTGVRRIGIGKDFIHVDVDATKDQEVLWLY